MRRWIDRATIALVLCVLVGVAIRYVLQHERPLTGAELFELGRTGIMIGEPEPAASIIVFNDYGCGWCAEYSGTLSRLLDKYPHHVAVVYKDFVLDSSGPIFTVHLAAPCAHEQGVFLAYRDAAFRYQDIGRVRNGWRRLADSAGVPDSAAFAACVLTERYAAAVRRDREEAKALGFTATPSSLFGAAKVSGSISDAIADSLIAEAIALVTRRRQ